MKEKKLQLELEKLSADVKVDVKRNVVTLYAENSKVYPLFNNIGEEMQVSENIPQTLLEISTGLKISIYDNDYIGIIKLNSSLQKQGMVLYTNVITDKDNGSLSLLVQNLGRKKITILKGTEVATIVFVPKQSISISIKEFEVK